MKFSTDLFEFFYDFSKEDTEVYNELVEFLSKYYDLDELARVYDDFPWLMQFEDELLDQKVISVNQIPWRRKLSQSFTPFIVQYEEVEVKAATPTPAKPSSTPSSPTLDRVLNNNNNATTTKAAEAPMATNKTVKDKIKGAGKRTMSAMQTGAIQGAVNATNMKFVEGLENALGDKYPELLKTPAGRQAVATATPALVQLMLEFDENKRIPGHDQIARVADIAVTGATAQATQELVGLLFQTFMPLLQSYAEQGRMFADPGNVAEEVDEEESFDFDALLKANEKTKVAA